MSDVLDKGMPVSGLGSVIKKWRDKDSTRDDRSILLKHRSKNKKYKMCKQCKTIIDWLLIKVHILIRYFLY